MAHSSAIAGATISAPISAKWLFYTGLLGMLAAFVTGVGNSSYSMPRA